MERKMKANQNCFRNSLTAPASFTLALLLWVWENPDSDMFLHGLDVLYFLLMLFFFLCLSVSIVMDKHMQHTWGLAAWVVFALPENTTKILRNPLKNLSQNPSDLKKISAIKQVDNVFNIHLIFGFIVLASSRYCNFGFSCIHTQLGMSLLQGQGPQLWWKGVEMFQNQITSLNPSELWVSLWIQWSSALRNPSLKISVTGLETETPKLQLQKWKVKVTTPGAGAAHILGLCSVF